MEEAHRAKKAACEASLGDGQSNSMRTCEQLHFAICPRHDEMGVRVLIERARVGMQHRDRPRGAGKLLVVLAKCAQRLPSAAQEQVIDHALMRPSQAPEFGRQGERDQEVLGRHEPLHLPFQPLLRLVVLTMRAVAMAAGVWNQDLVLATGALHLHLGTGVSAALLDGRERAIVIGGEAVAVLREELGREGVDD